MNHASTPGQQFLQFAIRKGVLLFGEFKTKAGRLSPYFFNAGLFNDAESICTLSGFYAEAIERSGIQFDMLYGPAYKGIPLVTGTAMALVNRDSKQNYPIAFNRKEAKDHGEGGIVIGAPLQGRVLIVDDVISAGTSVRESVDIIRAAGAEPAGVVIALDRQERGQGELSAVQEVWQDYGIPVIAVANRTELVSYLELFPPESGDDETGELIERIKAYGERYGTK